MLCGNLFSNLSSAFLAKILDVHVLCWLIEIYILFSYSFEIEHGWMSTSNSKSVALCAKNICSSKYFSLIPQQSMSQKLKSSPWNDMRLMPSDVLCWLKNVETNVSQGIIQKNMFGISPTVRQLPIFKLLRE